jgi:thymidylate synthase ThyX
MTKIEAKVLLDSVFNGERITTMELTYPRFIHAEYMTHRMFSRNAASSRAIPVRKLIQRVVDDPVIPIHWGANQRGMQAHQELPGEVQHDLQELWLKARDRAVETAEAMIRMGLHKQIANRILEPWMHITVIHSATSWQNFFNLRCHEMAEPHMRELAYCMQDSYQFSVPAEREWHLPLTGFPGDEFLSPKEAQLVSVARCARVSYLTHAGTRDVEADLDLAETLRTNGHFSPWEHVAKAEPGRWGNFRGWKQLRWWVERGLEWD